MTITVQAHLDWEDTPDTGRGPGAYLRLATRDASWTARVDRKGSSIPLYEWNVYMSVQNVLTVAARGVETSMDAAKTAAAEAFVTAVKTNQRPA